MKHLYKILALGAMLCVGSQDAWAQKQLYIPTEWKTFNANDTLLYKEVDTEGRYTWSKSRSKESDNFICYWDKYYTMEPTQLTNGDFYRVDIDDLLQKAESFYALNVGRLAFCDEATSKVRKYKMLILMNHTQTWTCYGGGYDFEIGALWLNPSTCKPVGQSVAHEVGHSFQYMCYSDLGGHSGFHDAIGNGSTFWEQTAQWQSVEAFPELKWKQSWSVFKHTANYAMTHEWMRYQSYWWHYYLLEKYGSDIIGKIWRHQMSKAADANEVLMDMMGYGAEGLYKDYFDYAMKMATIDLNVARNEAEPYIGSFAFNYVPLGGTKYQVAYASCPQSTGFNVIPLNVPEAGSTIVTEFTSLPKTAELLPDDPKKYYNGDAKYVSMDASKKTYNCASYSQYGARRGFRIGYVALLDNGTRQYIYEDSLYVANGTDTEAKTVSVPATIPANTQRLFLVIVPAPRSYIQHKWDDNIYNDDQWPYSIELKGTNLYGAPTISDERPISDATITYDVYFPKANDYSGTNVTLQGEALAALGTALQMMPSNLSGKLTSWNVAGPNAGEMMFYAVNANGYLSNTASSANGYGHWFSASGNRSDWANGYLYSEFSPESFSFSIGQYPNRLTDNKSYTIRQALKYNDGKSTAVVTFVFNVHVSSSQTGYVLSGIQSTEPSSLKNVPVLHAECRSKKLLRNGQVVVQATDQSEYSASGTEIK